MIKLVRAKENPILTPTNLPWEDRLVFNPGATLVNDKVYLLYRAMNNKDPYSRFGLATSSDGINFNRQKDPVYSGGGHESESLGVEDPRIAKIDGTYFITYTAVSEDLSVDTSNWVEKLAKKPQIALATTTDFKTFTDYDIIIPNLLGKNASFFPKKINGEYWLLYREGLGKTYFAKSKTYNRWGNPNFVFDKRPGMWDSIRTGIGAAPIETDKGWLLFYHGVDETNRYGLGIMFLNYDNPTKVIYRSPHPIIEPKEDYEKNGYVGSVIFSCGAVEKNDMFYIYYGAADRVIGVGTIDKKSVLNLL